MNADRKSQELAVLRASEKLPDVLARLSREDREYIEILISTTLRDTDRLEVTDLWETGELASTFCVLVVSGTHQEDEMRIAQELLFWKAFVAKDSAVVRCVQTSERKEYRCCSGKFEIVNCPTLVFSDSPAMESFVKVEAGLLFNLAAQKNGIERFLNKVHSLIENGNNLTAIEKILQSEKFWTSLKLVYSEIKGIVSVSVAAKLG